MKQDNEFIKIAKLAAWMDKGRWESYDKISIGDSDFDELTNSQKILVHWLCYINDYQRNVDELWKNGGIIFTEIVKDFNQNNDGGKGLERLQKFRGTLSKNEDNKHKINPFVVTKGNKNYEFTPKDWGAMYAIFRTLYILKTKYQGDILRYFSSQLECTNIDLAINIENLTKALYRLSYKDISKAKSSGNAQINEKIKSWWRDKESNDLNYLIKLFESDFKEEINNNEWETKRFTNKRLWAALRDYFQPSYKIHEIFLAGYEKSQTFDYLKSNEKEIMTLLEFPGDIWNQKFSRNTIQPLAERKIKENFLRKFTVREKGETLLVGVNYPHLLRVFYNQYLNSYEILNYYPIQMDVSFDFAPRMCDKCDSENMHRFCPFSSGINIKKLCNGSLNNDLFCPLLLFICGYRTRCKQEICPIFQNNKHGINVCKKESS